LRITPDTNKPARGSKKGYPIYDPLKPANTAQDTNTSDLYSNRKVIIMKRERNTSKRNELINLCCQAFAITACEFAFCPASL
jgi:hypothetical protein